MFKKSKKTTGKNLVNVSIRTMEGDIKGQGEKVVSVAYFQNENENGETNTNQATEDNPIIRKGSSQKGTISPSVQSSTQKNNFSSNNLSTTNKTIDNSQEKSFATNNSGSPFMSTSSNNAGTFKNSKQDISQSSLVGGGAGSAGHVNSDIGKAAAIDNQYNQSTSQSGDSPFLHQATGKANNNDSIDQIKKQIQKTQPKKSNNFAFIMAILVVLLLGGIMLAGYYFYMNKDTKTKTTTQKKSKNNQDIDNNSQNISNKTAKVSKTDVNNYQTNQTTGDNNPANNTNKPTNGTANNVNNTNKPVIPSTFTTSETSFLNDLKNFVKTINTPENENILKKGILVTPLRQDGQPLWADKVLTATGLDKFFSNGQLKNACKLFVFKDGENIRVGIVFEAASGVDGKLLKESIIAKEKDLPAVMRGFFVDDPAPTIQGEVKFSVNKNNKNSRYFNYIPGNTSSSVDWNVLDLGKGQIIYFATSKNLAEKITDYFMNLVMK